MLHIVTVDRHERVAVVRNGAYSEMLRPGRHWVIQLGWLELIRFDLRFVITPVDLVDTLPEDLPGTQLLKVAAHQRVVVRRDGKVIDVARPGRWRVWDDVSGISFEVVDIRPAPQPLADTDRLDDAPKGHFVEVTASGEQAVILKRDGAPIHSLEAGRYRVWTDSGWTIETVPLARFPLDLPAQDLVTADQVPVRVKAHAVMKITDPVQLMVEKHGHQLAYSAIHQALREVISGVDFEALMRDRSTLSTALLSRARALYEDTGLAIAEASVKDIILSAELKSQIHQVTLARKMAEAQAIKRREEVASTRQLANTAKLLAANPVLMRLRELEHIGELASRIDKLVVIGGPGDLQRQLMLKAANDA